MWIVSLGFFVFVAGNWLAPSCTARPSPSVVNLTQLTGNGPFTNTSIDKLTVGADQITDRIVPPCHEIPLFSFLFPCEDPLVDLE